ncbi:alpha/beta hydrolase [Gemmatimonas sp.]|uniref:alpha/beta hydrolase n=1 Tax=Gemmatimonas sp. TaxID=1962908 RepID=UPI0039834673
MIQPREARRIRLSVRYVMLLIVFWSLYRAGPRPSVEWNEPATYPPAVHVVASALPDSLANFPAWFAQQERAAGVTDPDVAKHVVFADSMSPKRTPWSVVYLHGFSATRQETAPLSAEVAEALGANLYETRLRGHGLPGDSLANVQASNWMNDAAFALDVGRRLGDSVLVIGTSTGGTLGVLLATVPKAAREDLRALVLISPNFGPKDRMAGLLTLPWASVVLPRFIPRRTWTAANEEQKRFWTMSYPSSALFPMQALVEYVRALPLTGYDTPTLALYNRNDQVVDAERTTHWLDALDAEGMVKSQRMLVIPTKGEDGHVIAGRIVSPSQTRAVRDRIVAFVRP